MSKFLFFLSWLVTAFLFVGCNQSFEGGAASKSEVLADEVVLPKEKFKSLIEYIAWVNDTTHGFIKHQSMGDVNYEIQFKPELIRALERFSSGTAINNNTIVSIIKDTAKQKMAYFNVKITGKGDILSNSFNTEKNMTEYFGYNAEKDFMLIQQADTLFPVLYHFENTYPQFPYLSVLLAFELPEDNDDARHQTFVFKGDSKGPLNVKFNKQQIFNQPEFNKINEIWQ